MLLMYDRGGSVPVAPVVDAPSQLPLGAPTEAIHQSRFIWKGSGGSRTYVSVTCLYRLATVGIILTSLQRYRQQHCKSNLMNVSRLDCRWSEEVAVFHNTKRQPQPATLHQTQHIARRAKSQCQAKRERKQELNERESAVGLLGGVHGGLDKVRT